MTGPAAVPDSGESPHDSGALELVLQDPKADKNKQDNTIEESTRNEAASVEDKSQEGTEAIARDTEEETGDGTED